MSPVPENEPLEESPPQVLARTLAEVIGPWLWSVGAAAAARGLGTAPTDLPTALVEDLRAGVERIGEHCRQRCADLLATDVDAQRHNPLALLREAAIELGRVLDAHGVPPATRDAFESEAFPEDHHRLVPAAWVDVDPRLQDPGITWGAWKAAQVLHRRREEGLR